MPRETLLFISNALKSSGVFCDLCARHKPCPRPAVHPFCCSVSHGPLLPHSTPLSVFGAPEADLRLWWVPICVSTPWALCGGMSVGPPPCSGLFSWVPRSAPIASEVQAWRVSLLPSTVPGKPHCLLISLNPSHTFGNGYSAPLRSSLWVGCFLPRLPVPWVQISHLHYIDEVLINQCLLLWCIF